MDKSDKNALLAVGAILKIAILVEHCQGKHGEPHALCIYCGLDKIVEWWIANQSGD